MIKTGFETRVKIHQILENQLPEFILSESPKAAEFLKQYYISQEAPGGSIDIVENLDQYLKLDNLTPEVITGGSTLQYDITATSETIEIENTKGFPRNYGLLKINDEIITYSEIQGNTFIGCVRGFSGITTYHSELQRGEMVFSTSQAGAHSAGSAVINLSSLFLKEFYKKVKYTLTPGLEDLDFVPELDVSNFIKEARAFYASKGTEESFRILFNVLYGVKPRVIDLEEYLIKPSASEFIRREIIIAERISGDPLKLVGQTIKKSTDPDTKASVSEVEILSNNGFTYYKLSLFVGFSENALIEGTFNVPGRTRVIGNIPVGSEVITVDSTVEFPNSGTVFSAGNTITYTDRTINQFLGCSGIETEIPSTSDIRFDEVMVGYEDADLTKPVELRITGVLSKFVPVSDINFTDEGEVIYVKNLGEIIKNPDENKSKKQIFSNSWIYNTSVRYRVKGISGSTFSLYSSIDKSSLKIGDTIEILRRNTQIVDYSNAVVASINKATREITLDNLSGFTYNQNLLYDIRRNLKKASSIGAELEYGNNILTSDVQNVYNEKDEYMYVASNSLPSFDIDVELSSVSLGEANGDRIQEYNPASLKYSILSFNTDVPFITGDEIYYTPESQEIPGLTEGLYYVRVLSERNKIKLYTSRSFIPTDDFIEFEELPQGSGNHIFTLSTQNNLKIGPQKSLKKFKLNPDIKYGSETETTADTVGLLIDGVEITSYKTNDKIFYGPLEEIKILNGGSNYDVINPPKIEISSGIGTTALVNAVVQGSVKEVLVDPQDFDIDDAISASLTGGNGSGCILRPITARRYREIEFNAAPTTQGGGLDLTNDDLSFINNHNISSGQALVYLTNDNDPISIGTFRGSNDSTGEYLEQNSVYYAQVTGPKTIRLYKTESDYRSGINTVGFTTESNSGFQKFRLFESKKTVTGIEVVNSGKGYTNRKLRVKPIGISTIDDSINFTNHGFTDKDIVEYYSEGNSISGLSSTTQYYVIKIDDNKFRLADAGIGATITSNYDRKKYVEISSVGTGYQIFKYPDISVQVNVRFRDGISGIVSAYPVVHGPIIDTYLYEKGTEYGSTILNLHKKPLYEIKTGRDAQIKTFVREGKIVSVQVLSGGREYYSTPELKVTGDGIGAKLRAIVQNNSIVDVVILNGGVNYNDDTTSVTIVNPGSSASLDPLVRGLTINRFSRFGEKVLRKSIKNLKYSVVGYSTDVGKEYFGDSGNGHSPIIGWALDGNPIYGPYGYSDPEDTDSDIKLVQSGYNLNINRIENRPPSFGQGFFVEDYEFDNSGDLDISNGRYCKTPDFPQGTYAYFSSVESSLSVNRIIPRFPYFIGDTFRSELLEETYIINQYLDFNSGEIIRNTLPYNVSDPYSGSDFLVESNEITNQTSKVESVLSGSVDSLTISEPGSNYRIGDSLVFDNDGTGGGGASAEVSLVRGKNVTSINTEILKYEDIVLVWKNENEVQGYISSTHTFNVNDNVYLTGISTDLKDVLGKNYRVGFSSEQTFLYKNIPASPIAGVVTDIFLSNITPNISIGSTIRIGSEVMSVLNRFDTRKILRVKRGASGLAHTSSSKIELLPSYISLPIKTNKFQSSINQIVYFNPTESIGVGNSVGFSTSVETTIAIGENFVENVSIPTQSIRIPNHPFKTNQRVLIKKASGSASLFVQNTPTSSINAILNSGNEEAFYVIKKSDDLIGIVTSVGLTTTTNGLFFVSNGSDDFEYYIRSDFPQVTADVNRVTTLVSLSTSHGLQNGDTINLSVKSNQSIGIGTSTAVKIKYDSQLSKILVNPVGFSSENVDIQNNLINLVAHGFSNGDKVYYTSDEVISGLNTGYYYIKVLDENNFNLCETLYDISSFPPNIVSIASTGGLNQELIFVNPELKVINNNNLVFDVTDSSLQGYNLKFYYDENFRNEFVSVGNTNNFAVSGVGTIGISSEATITLNYDSRNPQFLYYSLEKSGFISTSDIDVNNASLISYNHSQYVGRYQVFDANLNSNQFKISLTDIPEDLNYISSECDDLSYTTNSTTALGGIARISLTGGGSGYKKLPVVSSYNTTFGNGAKVFTGSTNIGKIESVRIIDPGFEYPSDVTLRPEALVPSTFFITDSDFVVGIDLEFGGKNYTSPPELVLINSSGKKINNGIIESVINGSSIGSLRITEPPKGLNATTHTLKAINNSNGFSISNVLYSPGVGIVTCTLLTPIVGFSTNVVNVGDKIFVEGIEKYGISGDGFNSEDHEYEFFTVSDYRNLNPAEVEFNLSSYTPNAGVAVTSPNFASIVRYEDYPRFNVRTGSSTFSLGDKLLLKTITGDYFETDWIVTDSKVNFIKAVGRYDLEIGDEILGSYSGTRAKIDSFITNNARFEINYSIRQDLGWLDNTGKLNEDYQVLPDNDYYQSLSYTVKSPITFEESTNSVNSLLHVTGLKNFSDTEVKSVSSTSIGSTTIDSLAIFDFIEQKRVDTINNFDFGVDLDILESRSNKIKIKNKKLAGYIECRSNRVLKIDDISQQFSNTRSSLNPYVELPFEESFARFLIQIINPNSTDIQATEILLVRSPADIITFEKSSIFTTDEQPVDIEGNIDQFDNTTLRFYPENPSDIDYDIKVIKSYFNSDTIGISTLSVGFVNLVGSVDFAAVGVTTEIISANKESASSYYITAEVYDKNRDVFRNLVELYITHDGTNTYQSEYFFDTISTDSNSNSFIGTFTSRIDGDNIFVDYENVDFDGDILIRSRIVGFGSTAVGVGTYRSILEGQIEGTERSFKYESNYKSTISSSASIASFVKEEVSTIKSLVRVSYGNTSALHQILLINNNGTHGIVQYPFVSIGSTSGIGTFGAEFSGSNANIMFYPDPSVTDEVKINAFNESIYTLSDLENVYPSIEFGKSREQLDLLFYNAVNGNRANKTRFTLKSGGNPVFSKRFNPGDTDYLEPSTGLIKIKNHYFSTGERLIYTPRSTFIGINSVSVSIGATLNSAGVVTTILPSEVYAIKIDNDQLKLATRKEYAQAGIAVTFTNTGSGNSHELEMYKKLEKSLITIDGIAQYPLALTTVNTTLKYNGGSIDEYDTIISLDSIQNILPEDIIKIDDELVRVLNVGRAPSSTSTITGVGTFFNIEVQRGYLGSRKDGHNDGSSANVYSGNYNIVSSDIYFTGAPTGKISNIRNSSNLDFERAVFGGRVYLRNDYTNNRIFDDISANFTGLGQTYTTYVGGLNTTGIQTGSSLVFLNGIFQTPTTQNNPLNNYDYVSNSGISSIVFTGITSSNGDLVISEYDINQNQLPRGGVIVSIGATQGLGFAPLYPAQIGIITNASGGIGSIVAIAQTVFPTDRDPLNIVTFNYDNTTGVCTFTLSEEHNLKVGDSLSLYGLEFECNSQEAVQSINVVSAVYTESTGIATITLASPHGLIQNRDYIKLSGLEFSCNSWTGITTYNVTAADYTESTGITTITTNANHGLEVGDYVKLANLEFSCNSWTGITTYNVTNLVYNEVVGIATITTNANHGLQIGDYVKLANIELACTSEHIGFSSTKFPYPAGTDDYSGTYPQSSSNTLSGTWDVYRVIAGTSGTTITLNVGISTIAHTYVSGGTATIGITTNKFPYPGGSYNTLGNTYDIYRVLAGTSGTTIVVNGGISTIAHTYVSGGTATIGITTSFFPYPGASANTLGDTYDVFPLRTGSIGTSLVLNVGVSTIAHTYIGGGVAIVGVTTTIFPYPGAGPTGGIYQALTGTAGTSVTVNGGISTITHTYVGSGICTVGLEWNDYNYGSGYYNNNVSIAITSPTGNAAQISAVVGVGGTLIFTIDNAGSGYASTNTRIDISEPSYQNLSVVGVSRLGIGSTTDTGSNALISLKVGANDNIAYDGRYYDAANLIDGNTQLIADVAVGRMLAYYPTFAVPGGNAECSDDIKTVIAGITYGLRFGGNDKVYDAANVYATNNYLEGEEEQAIYAFNQARDLAIQAMRNETIVTQTITSGTNADAANLILSNKKIIADVAVGRMLQNYPGFTIPGQETITPTNVTYDAQTGLSTITYANHGLFVGDEIRIATGSLTFTCSSDNYQTPVAYPRATDPIAGKNLFVTAKTQNTFTVNVGTSTAVAHQPTNASYDPATGLAVITIPNHGLTTNTSVYMTGGGFTFTCAMDNNSSQHTYPRSGDDTYNTTTGIISATTNTITLNVGASGPNQYYTPTNVTYDPATGLSVMTIGTHNLKAGNPIIILDNSLTFTCDMDGDQIEKTYPRPATANKPADYASGRSISIASTTSTTITVNVGASDTNRYFEPSAATYDDATGDLVVTIGQHGLDVGEGIVIAQDSFIFTCDQDSHATQHSYPRSGDPAGGGISTSITGVGTATYTITAADYDPVSGILTATIAGHSLLPGDYVKFADNSLTFTCNLDGNSTQHSYPRLGSDPYARKWIRISDASVNTIEVNVGSGGTNTSTHTFVSALTNGLIYQTGQITINVGNAGAAVGSAHLFVSASNLYFTPTDATYDPVTGLSTLTIGTHTLKAGVDRINLAPESLDFTCALDAHGSIHSYPRPGDPAYNRSVSIASTTSDTITVYVGTGGTDTSAHIFVNADTNSVIRYTLRHEPQTIHAFVGAATSAIQHLPQSAHTFVSATSNAIISGGDYNHQFVSASSGAITINISRECTDDIEDVLETIAHNLTYGGNDRVYDAAKLYADNDYLLGEEDESIFAYEQAKDLAILAMRNQEIPVYKITSGTNYDASNLIEANRTLIADVAYGRMLAAFPSFVIPTGDPQDCKDDIMDVTTEIIWNLRYGGNNKVWDAAALYMNNPYLSGEEAESIYAFEQARDIMIQVMRNEAVTISGYSTAVQVTDPSILVDPAGPPYCADVASALTVFVGIVTQAIGLSTISANRTSPTERYTYETQVIDLSILPDASNPTCATVESAITSFVGIVTNAIYDGTLPTRTVNSNTYTNEIQFIDNTVIGDASQTPGIYAEGDCANVASAIASYVGIITGTIDTGSIPASKTVAPGSLFQVTDFKIARSGYGFQVGDVFKPVGLVTDGRLANPINDFEITVLQTFTDKIASLEVGEFDYIDSVKDLQDGIRRRFPLYFSGQLLSFETNKNDRDSSLIDLNNLLLIYVNNVLQVPGEGYEFTGGTSFIFSTPPDPEDNVVIFFYNGTKNVDSVNVDIPESVKIGDIVQLDKISTSPTTKIQDQRTIFDIRSSDQIETNSYIGIGIDDTNYRPLSWTKQKIDKIINGQAIYKSRDSIESQIYPTSRIIKNVSNSDTEIFVDNAQFFYYEENESAITIESVGGLIIPETELETAKISVNVGSGGTISGINIISGGSGYTGLSTLISFPSPVLTGVGIGTTASATIAIINGSLTAPITITNPGYGYTEAPIALVSSPKLRKEKVTNITTVEGFTGIITGISTTTGTSGHSLALKLNLKNPGSNFTGLEVGYPIYIYDTSVGYGVTSVDSNNNSVVGVGTTFLDNIYYIHSITKSTENAEIITNINTGSVVVGIASTGNLLGRFSWGRLSGINRGLSPISIGVTGYTISVGLSTFPTIQRRDFGLRNNGSLRKDLG